MPRFVAELTIPDVSRANIVELEIIAAQLNKFSTEMQAQNRRVQWERAYIGEGDKIYCIYIAENEELIREHANLSGLSVVSVTQVVRVIDPVTGEG